jgi:hypothetical protein
MIMAATVLLDRKMEMSNAWNITETEYRKAQEMVRNDHIDAEDLWQLIRFYRGEVFYRDYAERGAEIVRAALSERHMRKRGPI